MSPNVSIVSSLHFFLVPERTTASERGDERVVTECLLPLVVSPSSRHSAVWKSVRRHCGWNNARCRLAPWPIPPTMLTNFFIHAKSAVPALFTWGTKIDWVQKGQQGGEFFHLVALADYRWSGLSVWLLVQHTWMTNNDDLQGSFFFSQFQAPVYCVQGENTRRAHFFPRFRHGFLCNIHLFHCVVMMSLACRPRCLFFLFTKQAQEYVWADKEK
jgi:hypothetical protein